MHRYGIATLFENYPNGYEFTEANTPLHLTHIDVLEIKVSPQEFILKLQQHLLNQARFTVMPIADILLGPNKDIPVTIVELNSKLRAFHEELISFLESEGAIFVNPHFLKDGYSPHISIYGSRRVKIGQPINITSVSVGNKRGGIENPPNRIIATLPLR
jgi:hypothetical protein